MATEQDFDRLIRRSAWLESLVNNTEKLLADADELLHTNHSTDAVVWRAAYAEWTERADGKVDIDSPFTAKELESRRESDGTS